METLAYTHAALEYETSLTGRQYFQTSSRRYPRRISFQKIVTAAALAMTFMMAGIAGTVLSPIGVDATRNLSR